MFSLKTHLVILVVLCYLYFVAWLVPAVRKFWSWQKQYRLRRLGRKIMTELTWFGPLWVVNSSKTVTAVCAYASFKHALDERSEKISKDPDGFWDTPILQVPQIFTFTEESVPFCTGSKVDIESIAVDLIFDLLDRKYDWSFIRKNANDLGKFIFRRDNRLFVPFAGSKWNPDWEQYRHTDVRLARLQLHKEVLDALSRST